MLPESELTFRFALRRSWRAGASASGIWLTTGLNIHSRDRPISHGRGRRRGESRSLMDGVQDFYLLL